MCNQKETHLEICKQSCLHRIRTNSQPERRGNKTAIHKHLYILVLSNKRNAPNIKLNHRFIFTLKDWMSVYVRYEYDKMIESTTKKYDH